MYYVHGRAIREARVSPPSHPLVRRELPGPLALEEDDGLGQSVSVVVMGHATVVATVGGGWEAIGGRDEADECEKAKTKTKTKTTHCVWFLGFFYI